MYRDLRMGLAFASTVRRRLEAFEPDLVHVATQGPLGRAAVAAARALSLPVTSDFRTNFHAYCGHYGLRAASRLVLGYLRAFHNRTMATFVPCRALREELAAQGFERTEVSGRGVDTNLFTPRRRSDELREFWGATRDTPVLLHVGRLAAEKNVALALRAFLVVNLLHPRACMVVVGDGPQRAQVEAEYPVVHFARALHGESLAIHYASADLFLFPSLTETFGNVTLEAMAAGLGVVAFDAAAAGELIRDGDNGLLATPGDSNGFIDAACRALSPDVDLPRLRCRARESTLGASWDAILRAFERRLGEVACATAVHDAALA
jgi:glycosyltransferase involved in cell wall biosynthesis